MTRVPGWLLLPHSRRVAFAAALFVAFAYQIRRPMEITADSLALRMAGARGLWAATNDFAWTRGASTFVLPEPGHDLRVRVDLRISGWRPRGQDPPLVYVRAGDAVASSRVNRRIETLSLETKTRGVLRSDLAVTLHSETFIPGRSDPRELGVRFHGVRLTPLDAALGLTRPPLRPLIICALQAFVLFGLLVRIGVSIRCTTMATTAIAVVWGLAFVVARVYAAVMAPPMLVISIVALSFSYAAPRLVRAALVSVREAGRAAGRGLRLAMDRRALALLVFGVAAFLTAHMARQTLDIDLVSIRGRAVARGFGVADLADGRRFLYAPRGARLDLSDFGVHGIWRIEVVASAAQKHEGAVLLRVGREGLSATFGPEWRTYRLNKPVPIGWRSGAVIEFPGIRGGTLRVASARIHRDGSFPAPRAMSLILGAALLILVTLLAFGVNRSAAYATVSMLIVLGAIVVALDPVAVIPFLGSMSIIVMAGSILGLLLVGAMRRKGERAADMLPPPAAMAGVFLGFLAWYAATAFPLYRGGHFVFHSSIASEIWQGRFLEYYLPYPGSMLSRQAQWGSIIVPHPCLYQTLVAPVAALPRSTFYFVEKGLLALGLATMAWSVVWVAMHVGGRRSAAFAGILSACLPPAFQLLGLGHLMTLLGCCATTWAFAFLVRRTDRITERSTWWIAVALLTFSFLSYTAAVLIGVFTLAMTILLWWREARSEAVSLATATISACALAFALYYVHWAIPFLSESLPLILDTDAKVGSFAFVTKHLTRLAQQPHKLNYTYGFWLFPLAGVAGTLLVRRRRERWLLAAWGASLIAFIFVDLFFNLLAKHHYLVIAPVVVGLSMLLDSMWRRDPWGRWAAISIVAVFLILGSRVAAQTAWGWIP
ncbi:MAG: hypothetical protein JXO72_08015 [Vicinamibacteria bacterium]|nr:hypothetical protein [Vicinamibacteria bacterium]